MGAWWPSSPQPIIFSAGNAYGMSSVFIRNRNQSITTPVVNPQVNGPSWEAQLNATGQCVVYTAESDFLGLAKLTNVFWYDCTTGNVLRISICANGVAPDDDSEDISVSADGTIITFVSNATNLTTTPTNGEKELFLTTAPTP